MQNSKKRGDYQPYCIFQIGQTNCIYTLLQICCHANSKIKKQKQKQKREIGIN